jgi:hypothetical protein
MCSSQHVSALSGFTGEPTQQEPLAWVLNAAYQWPAMLAEYELWLDLGL